MAKRLIFFLSYILFFAGIPVCVYFFWPVNVESNAFGIMNMEEAASGVDFQEMNSSYNKAIATVYRSGYASLAGLVCFLASLICTFFIALRKYTHPEKKIAGIAIGACIFNLLYIFMLYTSFFINPLVIGYYIYAMALIYIVFWIFLLIVLSFFIPTVILIIFGMIRGRRLAKQKALTPPAMPQTPQSSQHPQS
jgi:hypothetical protein